MQRLRATTGFINSAVSDSQRSVTITPIMILNKRSGNDGCLHSLDLINQNKLFPNHHIYFTCFFFFFRFQCTS
jgi:hypothetical protein